MQQFFNRYFSFQGRIGRALFYIRCLYLTLITTVMAVVTVPLFSNGGRILWLAGACVVAAALATLLLGIGSLLVRRLHDIGLSGWHALWVGGAEFGWAFLAYAPERVMLIAAPLGAICAWILFWPGSAGENRFGPQRA